jgi:thiamine-monophosphate kinase
MMPHQDPKQSASQRSSLGEFDLIERFFKQSPNSLLATTKNPWVKLGIGDDCALLGNWAISTDMLVEGRHFLPNANPEWLGHKCLAVNLSDLAAMGAKPVAFTLSLALPEVREEWLEKFSKGLFALADQYQCSLIGGDTTAGPLTVSITVFGEIDSALALRRSGAKAGDDIWVSHCVGDARLALGYYRNEWPLSETELANVAPRMHAPTPRVELGMALIGHAHAAIDISDGLLGDLAHILRASDVSADIKIDQVPAAPVLANKSVELRRLCTLNGGDDYELCFTAPITERDWIEKTTQTMGLNTRRIGKIKKREDSLMTLLDQDGDTLPKELQDQYLKSFDHFK